MDTPAPNTTGRTVLITGATGMIGSLILQHSIGSDEVGKIVSLVRRPSGITHKKLQEIIVEDFAHLDASAKYFKDVDVAYYCLGVYTGSVDREAFYTITVTYPDILADVLIANNPNLIFCLLSGAGADRKEKSRMMFAKDKGIIENRLSGKNLDAFYAFRPGYIYPVTQRQEPNFSYSLMRKCYPLLKHLGKSTSIPSTQLAEAMFKVGLSGHTTEVLENRDIAGVLS